MPPWQRTRHKRALERKKVRWRQGVKSTILEFDSSVHSSAAGGGATTKKSSHHLRSRLNSVRALLCASFGGAVVLRFASVSCITSPPFKGSLLFTFFFPRFIARNLSAAAAAAASLPCLECVCARAFFSC